MVDDRSPEKTLVSYPEIDGIDIPHPPLRAFCEYCLSVKPSDDFAERRHFDFFRLQPWLGFMMIVDYLEATRDFRYRLYGTHIVDQAGSDLTGSLVSELPRGVGDFVTRVYRESVDRKKVIYSMHTRVNARFSCDWHRVLCPVRIGNNIQVVGCNVPVAVSIGTS